MRLRRWWLPGAAIERLAGGDARGQYAQQQRNGEHAPLKNRHEPPPCPPLHSVPHLGDVNVVSCTLPSDSTTMRQRTFRIGSIDEKSLIVKTDAWCAPLCS